MIKVEMMEVFGPMCGVGKYYSISGSAIHSRSVKKAVVLAREAFKLACKRDDNLPGVPVLFSFTIVRDGKVIFADS